MNTTVYGQRDGCADFDNHGLERPVRGTRHAARGVPERANTAAASASASLTILAATDCDLDAGPPEPTGLPLGAQDGMARYSSTRSAFRSGGKTG